jgi:hypothetical protein
MMTSLSRNNSGGSLWQREISSSAISQHKDLIVAHVKKFGERGALDDDLTTSGTLTVLSDEVATSQEGRELVAAQDSLGYLLIPAVGSDMMRNLSEVILKP